MWRLIAGWTIVAALCASHGFADEFPPIGSRYDAVSDDARAIVKSLKKLEARTEIGVNFRDYEQAVSDLYPEVKVFIESTEAKEQPELTLVLANAIECHLKVRELWAKSISSDSAIEKYKASMAMITARPALWKVAGVNVQGASALIDSPKADLASVQESIAKNISVLTADSALRVAEEEENAFWRKARGEKTGVAVPAPPPAETKHDLAAIAFQPGDYGNDVTSGPIRSRLPPVYETVPPAAEEGEISLEQGGDQKGRIAVLMYDDVGIARKAYEAISTGFGINRSAIPALGNIATNAGASFVFRRHTAVVSAYSGELPRDDVVAALKRIDTRVAKIVGEGEMEAVPERPRPAVAERPAQPEAPANPTDAKEDSVRSALVEKLIHEGDFGIGVAAGPATDEVPPIYSTLPASEVRVSAPLMSEGKQQGGVTGFVFRDAATATKAYEQILSGFGSDAQKVARLGNAATAVILPAIRLGDVVFRRDTTVISIRCPAETIDQIVTYAKKIDARFGGTDEKTPPKATVTDSFDIGELRAAADELIKEGGEKALYAKVIVSIAGSKKWLRKGEDEPFEGTVVAITPEGAVFETTKGRVTLQAQQLSGDSGARIVRLKDVCRKLAALQTN